MMDIASLVLNEQDKDLMLRNALETIIQLYTDKAHFIYELLQNAEDAQATTIKFHQRDDRLEVYHDGIPFTLTNLRSLCNIRDSDKVNDFNKIGEFGVGFKSVFGICDKVRLYSMPRSIHNAPDILPEFGQEIIDFTHPRNIDLEPIPEPYTTTFVLPYCVGESFSGYDSMTDLKNALANRLSHLGITTLLFMRHLRSIEYEIDCQDLVGSGCYMLDEKRITDMCSLVTAVGDTNGVEEEVSYLKYSKKIPALTEFERTVDIAYPVVIEKDGRYRFVKPTSPYISVYFPTETESKLSIMVQGPYRTTPNRGGIPFNDKDNIMLAELTAELLYDSVLDIKAQGQISLQFLNLLPLEKPMFSQDWLFMSLYDKTIELFVNEPILPTAEGDYIRSGNAKIARGLGLINLFNGELLGELIKEEGEYDEDTDTYSTINYKWLPGQPGQLTEDTTELRNLYIFLKGTLDIEIIRADDLRSYLSQNTVFLKERDCEWLVQFYNYLDGLPRLVDPSNTKLNMLSVPFVKTADESFIVPFNRNGAPNVFMPTNGIVEGLPFVHPFVAEQCSHFFTQVLRLNEPDQYVYFKRRIQARYSRQSTIDLTDEEHIKDFELASKYLHNDEYGRDLLSTLGNLRFVQCISDEGKIYICPRSNDVYFELSKESESALDYLSPNDNIYFVNMDLYGNSSLNWETLCLFGVKNTLIENMDDSDWYYSGSALWRDEGDFRSNLTFSNIEEVLDFIKKNPYSDVAKEKSRIIMRLLFYAEKHLEGEIIKGKTRKERESDKSQIVKILTHGHGPHYYYAQSCPRWLFDKNGKLANPADISKYDLDPKIYGDVKINSKVYSILGFSFTEEEEQEDFLANIENQSEHTQDMILDRLLLKHIGLPLDELRSKMVSLETYEKSASEASSTSDEMNDYYNPDTRYHTYEFPSRPVTNLQRLREKIEGQYSFAPKVQYQLRELSQRISKDREGVRSYLEAMYASEINRSVCICQMCKKPSDYYWSVQIEKEPKLELQQMHILLCPDCAARYRQLRTDPVAYPLFIDDIANSSELQDEPISVSAGSNSINFTATHLAEIKEILRLLRRGMEAEDAD